MGDLLLSVEMVSTLYILLWHGEIDHLVQLWSLFGHLMENMLLERVPQRLRFSVKTSRFVFSLSLQVLNIYDNQNLCPQIHSVFVLICVGVCVCKFSLETLGLV